MWWSGSNATVILLLTTLAVLASLCISCIHKCVYMHSASTTLWLAENRYGVYGQELAPLLVSVGNSQRSGTPFVNLSPLMPSSPHALTHDMSILYQKVLPATSAGAESSKTFTDIKFKFDVTSAASWGLENASSCLRDLKLLDTQVVTNPGNIISEGECTANHVK